MGLGFSYRRSFGGAVIAPLRFFTSIVSQLSSNGKTANRATRGGYEWFRLHADETADFHD